MKTTTMKNERNRCWIRTILIQMQWLIVVISATLMTLANAAPVVTITSPTATVYAAEGSTVTISANASEVGGSIAKVDFYVGGYLVGTVTSPPYTYKWFVGVPVGPSLIISVKATDTAGVSTTVKNLWMINVTSNFTYPIVNLISPTVNQNFSAPAAISINAQTQNPANNMTMVQLFQNGTLLQNFIVSDGYITNYIYNWTGVAKGAYTLKGRVWNQGSTQNSPLVPITVGTAQTTGLFYIYADHVNTPRLVTDSNGIPVWRNLPIAEPFGNSPVETDPSGLGTQFVFNLRFPGQYADQETNTNYNFYRDYDPNIGRYLESDPIGLKGGSYSTYAYVNGNPINIVDAYGLILGATLGGVTRDMSLNDATAVGSMGNAAMTTGAAGAVAGLAAEEAGIAYMRLPAAIKRAIGVAKGLQDDAIPPPTPPEPPLISPPSISQPGRLPAPVSPPAKYCPINK